MLTESVAVSSEIYLGFESQSCQSKNYENWYLLLLRSAHSIKEYEQRPVGSQSGVCVRVKQRPYTRVIVSLSYKYASKSKRICLL